MDVDGCWLSVFVGDCLLQKKDSRLCIFVCLFGQSYHVCFFWVKSVTKRPMFQKFWVFVGGSIEKSKQSIHKLELIVRPTWLYLQFENIP